MITDRKDVSARGDGPAIIFWETTAACNLSCSHCRRRELSARPSPGEISIGEALSFIRGLGEWCRPLLVLSGGEPLLRPDIIRIASAAASSGLAVAVATNGTMVTPEIAGEMAGAGVRRVSVSLDGAAAETHDGIRGVRGAFDSALRGIRILRASGLSAQINMTVCAGNAGEIEKLFSLAGVEGVDAVHLFLFVPVGCGLGFKRDGELSAAERNGVMEWFLSREGGFDFEARLTCAPQCAAMDSSCGARRGRSGCLAGRTICFISSTGEVFPCGYLPVTAGNIRESDFKEIWNDSELFHILRDRKNLKSPCGACLHRERCGGCRARIFAETGDWLAGDGSCVRFRVLPHCGTEK